MKPDSYFLAVTMPSELAEKAQKYRDRAFPYSRFKTPLHITIIPPFTLEFPEDTFIMLLENNINLLQAGEVTLDSFDYFEGRNSVLYLTPDKESEIYLKELKASLSIVLKDIVKPRYNELIKSDVFHPHLTIAI